MQLKKVYRVLSVSESNTKFDLSEEEELNGISLDQIRNAIKSGRLRKQSFERSHNKGLTLQKLTNLI
jgi:hypothetical protein